MLQHQGARSSTSRWPSTCWPTWCCIPLFHEEDIEKEKGVILEEIKMEADSPDYLVHEIFSSNFWKDHPLGKPILGTRETVKRFDQDADPRLLLGRVHARQPAGDGGRAT